jgi:hypothetical protein
MQLQKSIWAIFWFYKNFQRISKTLYNINLLRGKCIKLFKWKSIVLLWTYRECLYTNWISVFNMNDNIIRINMWILCEYNRIMLLWNHRSMMINAWNAALYDLKDASQTSWFEKCLILVIRWFLILINHIQNTSNFFVFSFSRFQSNLGKLN